MPGSYSVVLGLPLGLRGVVHYKIIHLSLFFFLQTKPHEYITTHGPECPEHSFFPGYAWTSISCGRCSKHLGWGFTPIPTEATAATLAAAVALLVSVAGGEEWTGTMEATEATFDYTKSFSFFGYEKTSLLTSQSFLHHPLTTWPRGNLYKAKWSTVSYFRTAFCHPSPLLLSTAESQKMCCIVE